MLKWFTALLASVSSLFVATDRPNVAPPLNTAIIAYQETYYVPAVTDPDNFPRAKSSTAVIDNQEVVVKKEVKITPPPAPIPTPPAPPVAPPPAPTLPPTPVGDPYLANPEPIVDWYVPVTFRDNSANATGILPEMTFDREYWRMEVFAYWAPGGISKSPVEKDYFKLEVYEKGTDKLIYTMTSGIEDSLHRFQAFKKPGTYYFKTFLKNPSQFEITFTFSGQAVSH